ncbi:hypothetical protein BRAS3843_2460031 [Bradyrhizobium sp. STM 3843]|nr:hypothetical protein BRAS3843_2460031 [Bradyrhizobium sp. STM 3843]
MEPPWRGDHEANGLDGHEFGDAAEMGGRAEGSGLTLRSRDDQTIELVGHLDLARQARVRPHVIAEVQHVLFHRRRRPDLLAPGFVDIDMAGGAGAGAAAFGLDAGDGVADGRFHHGCAVLDLHGSGFAVMVDKGNLGHVCSMLRRDEVGLSYNGSTRPALVPVLDGFRPCGWRQNAASISAIAMRASPTAASSSASAKARA